MVPLQYLKAKQEKMMFVTSVAHLCFLLFVFLACLLCVEFKPDYDFLISLQTQSCTQCISNSKCSFWLVVARFSFRDSIKSIFIAILKARKSRCCSLIALLLGVRFHLVFNTQRKTETNNNEGME